ncbi:DNA mismatch repair endonuclease MutL [Paraglaciecola aquimarina]|uniref:DNA mismatch repair protein MutL n=1 Tax=Paraglaciecola aquimarina TaxID=1235557 RepID=A0ABU3SUD8_9ALTE|nr:DNA mismatch repair endonuclease MutL [Paraglaciecola aquimarina]MDU0353619.1 DNA mismatch repair endonuclease MutL [Paraglaciecola aquimarina]
MSIQILPARLANQIAAGEVVERPSSVVKELVENSLDSAATSIEIEIEKGGHKRILIRDNGSGIASDELALALSRHATSKITCLDDLEAIHSLGFRGEALASISSVARLTLTSKPEKQQQAWQAHCEGRDMQVQVNPVAHPAGTSVDVADLFFNTPARRKFLKTEKTEFAHIDEVVRRIALSRFDVSFSLKHNGKVVRKYPAISASGNKIKRLTAICGKGFTDACLEINSQYQKFELHGWMLPPTELASGHEFQYVYVNGRMMRDKLINHAIRQAFEGIDNAEFRPGYVLYLSIEHDQVDVNVHPAKHEVRFHQARLVHDFIFRALSDVLKQYLQNENSGSATTVLPPVEPDHDYIQPLRPVAEPYVHEGHTSQYTGGHVRSEQGSPQGRFAAKSNTAKMPTAKDQNQSFGHYQQLMGRSEFENDVADKSEPGQWLRLDDDRMLLTASGQYFQMSVSKLQYLVLAKTYQDSVPVSQPLLMPISIEADLTLLAQAKLLYQPLLASSVEIGWAPKRVILRKVPAGLRQVSWGDCLASILTCSSLDVDEVRKHLLTKVASINKVNNNQIQHLWQQFMLNSTDAIGQLTLHASPILLNELLTKYDT